MITLQLETLADRGDTLSARTLTAPTFAEAFNSAMDWLHAARNEDAAAYHFVPTSDGTLIAMSGGLA